MSWLHRIFINPATVFHTECDVLALIKVLITAFTSSINKAMAWRVVGEMMLSSRWGGPSSVSTSKSEHVTTLNESLPYGAASLSLGPSATGHCGGLEAGGALGGGGTRPRAGYQGDDVATATWPGANPDFCVAWLPAVKILISEAVLKFYLFLFLLFLLLLALLVTDCTCQCFPASCSLYTAL